MKILLATDGSEGARAAADFLCRLPFADASELVVLTVLESVLLQGESEQLREDQRQELDEAEGMLRHESQRVLADETDRLHGTACRVSTSLRAGHPAEVIIKTAGELGIDLVVVGSHGRSGVKRFLLGSVSDHVLKYAHCSVLIVKQTAEHTAGIETIPVTDVAGTSQDLKILIAYDDSTPARKAVELCFSLDFGGNSEVELLTVLPLVTQYRQDIRQRLSGMWREKKRLAQEALEQLADDARWSAPRVSVQLRESADVSQEILDTALELGSDLILLGHKGKSAIERFLLGSVTARIAHHAPCSVLSVR